MREKLIELLKLAMDYSYVLREMKSTTTDANEDPFIAMADLLITNGVTIQRWIPVTERLPGVWMIQVEEEIREPLEFIVFIKNAELPTVKFFNGKNFCDDNGYIYDVTHWMPLPEPPKGE